MSHKHINNIDPAVSSAAEEWTDDPSSQLPPTIPDVSEQIFQCIQSGNDVLEEISTAAAAAATDDTSSSLLVVVDSSKDEQLLLYWKAAEYYMHACELLLSLLLSLLLIPQEPQQRTDNKQLQQLYQEQINYYYPKTRSCIIKALQQQHALEEHPLHHDIIPSQDAQHHNNDEAHQYQFHILHRFYQFRSPVTRIPVRIATHSTSTTIHSTTTHNNDENGTTSRNHKNHHHHHHHQTNHHSHNDTDMNDTVETTTSHVVVDDDDDTTTTTTRQLEQRLRQLNATLPIHLKSEEEVQRQRHEQLRRIGVPTTSLSSSTSNPDHHLYSSEQSPFSSSLLDTIPGRPRRHGPDDEIQYIDPVDAIIAQVTEEVRLLPLQQSSLESEPDLEEEIMDLNREVQEYWIKEQLLLTKDDENDKDEENDNEDDDHENDDSDDKDDDDTTDSTEGNR